VRPVCVVVDPPRFDRLGSVSERDEQALVQTFIAQLAVERLDEGVLCRLAGSAEPAVSESLSSQMMAP
jgi:hypothetical protein